MSSDDKIISRVCKIAMKGESAIYSVIIVAFTSPVRIAVWIWEFLKVLALGFTYLIENVVVPFARFVVTGIVFIYGVILVGLYLLYRLLLEGSSFLKKLFALINWCAVRSLLRTISVISIISSIIVIIYEYSLQHFSGSVISGRFFDANPNIMIIHEGIVLIMLSVIVLYYAWVYSKDEEIAFVCKNVAGVSLLKKIKEKMW